MERLPPDHLNVFRAVTKYSYVERTEAYRRLGYFGEKLKASRRLAPGYLKSFRDIPIHLCSPADFRAKIAGGNGNSSIVHRNYKPYGVPQGLPISDLLANASLIEFDSWLNFIVQSVGGKYYRYSDDILIIVSFSEQKRSISLMSANRKFSKPVKN